MGGQGFQFSAELLTLAHELVLGIPVLVKPHDIVEVGDPDPRVNLAFTLESAERTDEAIATYRTALEVLPDDIAAMQGLARLQVRSGKRDEQTARLLSEIAMRGETPAWRNWAKEQAILGPAR